jgi:hypothetical protein
MLEPVVDVSMASQLSSQARIRAYTSMQKVMIGTQANGMTSDSSRNVSDKAVEMSRLISEH